MRLSFYFIMAAACVFTAAVGPPADSIPVSSLKYLGKYNVPYKKEFKGTTLGGLSGIDYDPKEDIYYVISDDRSAINPVRFYTVKIYVSPAGIDSLNFIGYKSILRQNGTVYPAFAADPKHTPDPEAIRYNASNGQLVWTSEGERIVNAKGNVLVNPSISLIKTTGEYVDTVAAPRNTRVLAVEKGTRRNGGFESITYSPDYRHIFYAVELPLYEDGVEPKVTETQSWVRIFDTDLTSGKNTAQYAYRLESVAYPADPETGFIINGLVDMLALGDGKFLTLERSFSTGRLANTIKVFLTDISGAENIIKNNSLTAKPPVKPAVKKLILNMDDLGVYTDNIEGATFGPMLPNGHRTLIAVSDDNFNLLEKTQFLLFEVIP